MAQDDKVSRQISAVCVKLLGLVPDAIEYPGGRSRGSARICLGDERIIITRRSNSRAARREATIMEQLHSRGAPVPKVVAFDGFWLLQEDLGDRRLSHLLHSASVDEGLEALTSAIDGLERIHQAGQEAGLVSQLRALGHTRDWALGLAAMPRRVSGRLGVSAPEVDPDALADIVAVRQPRLVKWDARPGNANLDPDNRVVWFDWEHSGSREWLDDLAWLLGDEYMPDWLEREASELIEGCIDRFRDQRTRAEALQYLAVFGALHMCVRLDLVVRGRDKRGWRNFEECLTGDRVGVTPECARGLCRRGAKWVDAYGDSPGAALATWFRQIEATFA